ncbi:MAG: FAD-binding oxidoreductase [Sulfurimonas sp.]|uniref:NAD(P)/FAD-dependent oxidoreductase n=1 Tax=Sulfurimonas sp. TaxID=2022749 RepID=UPI0025E3AA1E|nr:FAD-binding oxidoreductase [Sulfurimonas sp.]MCK9492361.1 FAD-binding oxidoreductase [Sulfurimonas sp.]
MYDYLIIGAGSAGCAIAHFLNKAGKSVAIIDRDGVASGASGAAGAFLSPLAGKKNPYNSFVNDSLTFSLDFYEKLSSESFIKKGVLRVADENFSKDSLNELENEYYSSQKLRTISSDFKDIEGFFYKEAAYINPSEILHKMIEGCDLYIKEIIELKYEDEIYSADGVKTKNIILTQGVSNSLVDSPYIGLSPIFGLRLDAKTTTKVPFNIHKSISISTNKKDNTIAIGATQQRHDSSEIFCNTSCDKCSFYVDDEKAQVEYLLNKANELIELKDLEVIKTYTGARSSIKSYFPVVGKLVDYNASLKKYPSIKNGTMIPKESLLYHPNIYIINALGSRGFVFAPYLAKILSQYLLENLEIPSEISTQKLFFKYARKKVA